MAADDNRPALGPRGGVRLTHVRSAKCPTKPLGLRYGADASFPAQVDTLSSFFFFLQLARVTPAGLLCDTTISLLPVGTYSWLTISIVIR